MNMKLKNIRKTYESLLKRETLSVLNVSNYVNIKVAKKHNTLVESFVLK